MKSITCITATGNKEIQFADNAEIFVFGNNVYDNTVENILSVTELPDKTIIDLWNNYFSKLDLKTLTKIQFNNSLFVTDITKIIFTMKEIDNQYHSELSFHFNNSFKEG